MCHNRRHKGSPARIGGIKGKSGIHHRHNQLWPGERCNFFIHIGRGDFEILSLGKQIANIFEEITIEALIEGMAAVHLAPGVDLFLQRIALGQKRNIPWGQQANRIGKTLPENAGIHACSGEDLLFNQSAKRRVHP